LNTSTENASLTIQINWIVLGLMNPIIGSLSDKHGRKKIIYVSVISTQGQTVACCHLII
jgi:MFS family permease